MALDNRQKWGVGLCVSAVAFGTVGGLAIAKVPLPEIVPVVFGAAEMLLIYFGIKSFVKPPTEPPM